MPFENQIPFENWKFYSSCLRYRIMDTPVTQVPPALPIKSYISCWTWRGCCCWWCCCCWGSTVGLDEVAFGSGFSVFTFLGSGLLKLKFRCFTFTAARYLLNNRNIWIMNLNLYSVVCFYKLNNTHVLWWAFIHDKLAYIQVITNCRYSRQVSITNCQYML